MGRYGTAAAKGLGNKLWRKYTKFSTPEEHSRANEINYEIHIISK